MTGTRIGQQPQVIEFTPEQHEQRKAWDEQLQDTQWTMVYILTEIVQSGLFLITHTTFADYLKDVCFISEATYRQWKSAFVTHEQAAEWGVILKNQYAARALRETKEAARETVGRMAKAKAGEREVTARDIRNAANALMEAMENVAAGDDVAALPALAEQSHNEANQRTSMAIDKRQGWSSVAQWRVGQPLPDGLEPGQIIELKWRMIDEKM